ncbi:MAG: flagellar basal body rod protein FlgB [Zoogloeaceae bacterium]|nr:flagellar basal body rod protein FlgB [Rhodocyclaceae bacterium]MCP5255289.1 flagellar basal body rod protein FlgB [Zoogloeaceae bacterium]MCP5294833.1 flagellar basal body rod protein FlgB [Zoogloeaceae bacterium]MCW5616678.1 flagellar basal body rod protein FlgB [Rhodocyclaceae bacterium]
MSNSINSDLAFHQQALNTRAYRQQLLASNIANADTPNYKARDVDFSSALKGALGSRMGPLALATTNSAHLSDAAANPLEAMLRFRTMRQGAVDGNTVDMDVERSAFAENAIHYEASLTFINGLLSTMQQAIQSQ